MAKRSIFFVFLTTLLVESFFTCDLTKTKKPTSTDILDYSKKLHSWIIEYNQFMVDSIPMMEVYLYDPSTEGIWQIQEKHMQFWRDIDKGLLEYAINAVLPPNKEHVNYERFMCLYSKIFLQKTNTTKQTDSGEITPNQNSLRVVVQQGLWKRFLRLIFACLPIANPYDYKEA